MLKDSNRQGLTKKEVQKMERRLEKAQMQAARLAYQREQREKKEAQRAKIEAQDELRREKEAEEEEQREKVRQELREHQENEYQNWKKSHVKVVEKSSKLYDSAKSRNNFIESTILKMTKAQVPTQLADLAKETNLTINEVR